MMIKTIVFHAVSIIATAANAQTLPPCHQELSSGYAIGYQCQGNSGTVFSFGGDRWDMSTGESWIMTQQRANFDDAKALCHDIDALVPSPQDFDALTAEFRNPTTGALPLLFPVEGATRFLNTHWHWTANSFSSALGYIWDSGKGNTNGRYFKDLDFLVICKK